MDPSTVTEDCLSENKHTTILFVLSTLHSFFILYIKVVALLLFVTFFPQHYLTFVFLKLTILAFIREYTVDMLQYLPDNVGEMQQRCLA